MDDLAQFMGAVARDLLGDPNPHLSSDTELRFGHHGSMSVDLEKGTAFSHEDNAGGGVLWLIKREKHLEGKDAFDYLREIGLLDYRERELSWREISAPKTNGHAHEPRKIVAAYDYVDEDGKLLFQAVRFEPKFFRQRAPDGEWKVKGIRQVPYRLPELIEAIANERTIFIVEGEKDVENLRKWNIPSTCNAGGANKWRIEHANHLRDADVVIVPDNDEPGREHANAIGSSLQNLARRIRLLHLPGLGPKGDISDWIAAGGTPEDLWKLVEKAPLWAPSTISRFGGLRWNAIGAPGSPAYEWVVENIIPKGEPILIFGDSGTGKSFLAFDMSLCIARGIPFYGRNVERGLVVYVAAEGGKGFSKRKIAYSMHHQLGQEDIPFYLMTKRPDFFSSDADADALIAEIEVVRKTYSLPLLLTVLDTMSALTPGMNENASQDVSKVRARVQKLIDAFGAAAAFVHHTPKNGTTPRGHGSLTADVETTIQVTTTEIKTSTGLPVQRATGGKQREEKKGVVLAEFTLPVVVVGKNKWGNDETSCVPIPYTAEHVSRSAGFHATPTELLFMEALFEALNEVGVPPPAGLPAAIVKAVDLAEVRSRMRQRYVSGEEDSTKVDQRFRQAFKRAADALKGGKVIGYKQPLVWATGKPVRGLSATVVT